MQPSSDPIETQGERPAGNEVAQAVRVGGGPWLWTARARRGFLGRLFASRQAAEAEAHAYDRLDADLREGQVPSRYAREAGRIADLVFYKFQDLDGRDAILAVLPKGDVLWSAARSLAEMHKDLRTALKLARERRRLILGARPPAGRP